MTTPQAPAKIDPDLWKVLDIISRQTRIPKKHLLSLFAERFVNSEEGQDLLQSHGMSQDDLDTIRDLLKESSVLMVS